MDWQDIFFMCRTKPKLKVSTYEHVPVTHWWTCFTHVLAGSSAQTLGWICLSSCVVCDSVRRVMVVVSCSSKLLSVLGHGLMKPAVQPSSPWGGDINMTLLVLWHKDLGLNRCPTNSAVIDWFLESIVILSDTISGKLGSYYLCQVKSSGGRLIYI